MFYSKRKFPARFSLKFWIRRKKLQKFVST